MSGTIDNGMVRRVARLARIHLSDDDVPHLVEEFRGILRYFDKLQVIDTSGVEPMVHAVEIRNVLAEDKEGISLPREEALANAAREDGEFFAVPRILGTGS